MLARACCHTCGWIHRAVSKRFPPGTIIYHNVAPREDDEQARAGNAGERLAFARLPTVCALSASTLAMPSPSYAMRLHYAGLLAAEGSQSRSRDLFPQAAAAIAGSTRCCS